MEMLVSRWFGLLLCLLPVVAHAQEAPPVGGDPVDADGVIAAARQRLDELTAELEKARGDSADMARKSASLQAVFDDAATLLDNRRTTADRAAAAHRLGASETALPFLRAAARDRDPAIQLAAVRAVAAQDTPGATELARDALFDPLLHEHTRRAAVETLVALRRPDAGEALWLASNDRALSAPLRRVTTDALRRGYPDLVAVRGEPRPANDPAGLTVGMIGNGVAGSVLLASIGTWGSNDTAVVIGGVGGAVIGVGTGALYGALRPVSRGQGLLYASNVGWGLTAAELMVPATFGADVWWNDDKRATREDAAAVYRSVGVTAGAASALVRFEADPRESDVLEADLAGVLGLGVGMGLADLLLYDQRVRQCEENPIYGLGYAYASIPETEEYPGYEPTPTESCPPYDGWTRGRNWGALVGGAAGIGLASRYREGWTVEVDDLAFATVVAGESAWIGGWLPTALGGRDPKGNVRLALHGGFAGGLAFSHLQPLDLQRTGGMAWGAAFGNGLGAGLPLVAGSDDGQVLTLVMLPVGLAGTVGGAFYGDRHQMSGGDLSMMAIGLPLATFQGLAVGMVLEDHFDTWDGARTGGLVLTAGSVTGMALMGLATQVDPEPADMFFLGSAAAWGAWYGALTPISLESNLADRDILLVTSLSADAVTGLGGLLISSRVNLDPRSTVVAQLGGVAGATMGGMGVAMGGADGPGVARGALLGSVVGLGGGALVTSLTRPRKTSLMMPRPHFDLPGRWSATVNPTVLEHGEPGWYAGLAVSGL